MVDAPQEWCLPETWVHPEVVYEVVLEPGQALPTWLPESTTIHTAPCGAARGKLRRLIAAIDLAAALPIDYLITRAAPKALALACRSERIPMVSLTS